MNFAAWISSLGLDLELCGRLCLVLAHSLWQFALLAALATFVARVWKNAPPERIYAIYAGALLVGLLALPLTLTLSRLPGEPVAFREALAVPRQQIAPAPKAPSELQIPVQQAAPPVVASAPPALPAATQRPPQAATTSLLTWAPWLVGCYVVGVTVMLLRLIRSLWQNYRLSAQATPIAAGPLVETLQRLARTWSLRVTPALACTQRVIVPQVVGLWRPVILLPAAALAGLRPDELEMILAHELAHVRRYDLWMNLVQRLAEAVLFFNPAVWYLSRRVSLYREYCCDEATCRLARQTADDTRLRYAEALLRAVELTQGAAQGQKLAALAASGNRPSELRRRVARLFGEPLREPVRISRSGLVTIAAGIAVLAMIPLARQNAAETKEETKQSDSDKKPTVEMVAIGSHDEEPQRWWDAEGKLLGDVPFVWSDANNVSSSEKVWRRVVFRINDLPKDAEVTWQVLGGGSWGDATATPLTPKEDQTLFARYVGLTGKNEALGLRVGIARGPWVTSVKGEGLQANGILGTGIIFSGAFPKDDGCVLVLSHNLHTANVRVVAIDKAGKLAISDSVHAVSAAGGLNQMHWVFKDLKPSDVDHFEFQTRLYEWAEIKDLPVEPGEKAKVAVEPQLKEDTHEESDNMVSVRIAFLEKVCADYEENYQRVNALHEQGLRGGEPANKWLAFYHLSIARAELATAKGEQEQAIKQHEEAIKAAEKIIQAQLALYEAKKRALPREHSGEVGRDDLRMEPGEATARRARDKSVDASQGASPRPRQIAWTARLLDLTDHNPTAFSIGPQMIAELSPQEAWEVVRTVWPEIEIDEVKTGLLKTFEFARHPKVLDVLDLGATDNSKFVREYAYSYLQNYALRDFKQPEHDYQSWQREFANKTTDEVLAANCQWFVDQLRSQPPITDPQAWQEVEMMLELSGSKSSYPQKAEYLRKAGLPEVLRSWRDQANLDDRMKRSITTFLGKLDKTLDESLSYEKVDLSGRNLAGLVLQGNVDGLFTNADLSKVNLSDATIVGGFKAFSDTIFAGADLTRATLIGRAAFQSANFVDAILLEANLKGDASGFQNANFNDADLRNSRLTGGSAAFQGASFNNADLQGARLQGGFSSFQMANFDNANLTDGEIKCSGATAFQSASLNSTNFSRANISEIDPNALASSKFDAATPPRYDAKTKFPEGFDPHEHEWTEIKDLPVEPGEKVTVKPQPKEEDHKESRGLASEKIAALEELLASYEAMYERTETLHKQGLAGGEPTKKWLALYHLSMTRAELAETRGETAKALQHYDEAIEAADEIIHSAQALHEAGRGSSESALEGGALRAKAKLAKIEAQERPQ